MKPAFEHPWDLTPAQARALQDELRGRVSTRGDGRPVRLVAGADIALDKAANLAFAGVIVFRLPGLEEVERAHAIGPLRFPYVPGLLSFREGPHLLEAFRRLRCEPDLLLFDGQGIAHPRRLGLASHVSLLLDCPGIGVAKSRLCGTHDEPLPSRGSWTPLQDGEEVIGAVLRTRDRVTPIFVSIGHRIDLPRAIELALACGDGYRVPKPTRLADHYVGELKRRHLAENG